MNFSERFVSYIKESRQELMRVNWPDTSTTTRYTIFVIILSIGLAAFLGLLDFIFTQVLKNSVLL